MSITDNKASIRDRLDGVKYICVDCSSGEIMADMGATWNVDRQDWEVAENSVPNYFCPSCGYKGGQAKEVSRHFIGWCPECDGENTNEEGTVCWDCDPELDR